MKTQKNDFIILSADNTETLKNVLEDLNYTFQQCTGKYKGTIETSFLVRLDDQMQLDILKKIAFNNFNQESVLIRINGKILLVYSNGNIERFDSFKMISKKQAEKLNAYTFINQNYYILKK